VRVIAIANHKGGVGKTTVTITLGAALAERMRRVLLIEMDPQHSLGPALGLRDVVPPSIHDVLVAQTARLEEACRPVRPCLDAVLATEELAAALYRLPLSPEPWQWRLADALADLDQSYDFCLIDTPPALGTLTTLALTAADDVIVPTQLEAASWRNAGELFRTIADVRSYGRRPLNPKLKLFGVLPTFVDLRSRFARALLDEMRRDDRIRVLEPGIKRSILMAEATLAGEPITSYAPDSDMAAAFRRLAEEVDHAASS
jgi:chromosome partitioning protein